MGNLPTHMAVEMDTPEDPKLHGATGFIVATDDDPDVPEGHYMVDIKLLDTENDVGIHIREPFTEDKFGKKYC